MGFIYHKLEKDKLVGNFQSHKDEMVGYFQIFLKNKHITWGKFYEYEHLI